MKVYPTIAFTDSSSPINKPQNVTSQVFLSTTPLPFPIWYIQASTVKAPFLFCAMIP